MKHGDAAWSVVVWSLALPATVVIRTRAPAHHQDRELQRFVDPFVDGAVSLAKSTGVSRPVGVAVDTAGDVYVADWGKLIEQFVLVDVLDDRFGRASLKSSGRSWRPMRSSRQPTHRWPSRFFGPYLSQISSWTI
jgi:hypothetical protein